MPLLTFALFVGFSFAGGNDKQDVIKALNELSEKSILTNYFLSHPESKLCKNVSGIGQRLAMATEEFKAVWHNFKPTEPQLKALQKYAETCGEKDQCFSLNTLMELNPKAYGDLLSKTNKEWPSPKYDIKNVSNPCQKIKF